jgi:signal transduction histidine kinase/DNA-binding response OmpR family regulator
MRYIQVNFLNLALSLGLNPRVTQMVYIRRTLKNRKHGMTEYTENSARLENYFRSNEANYSALYYSDNIVIWLDDNDKVIKINESAESLLGWSAFQAVGAPFDEVCQKSQMISPLTNATHISPSQEIKTSVKNNVQEQFIISWHIIPVLKGATREGCILLGKTNFASPQTKIDSPFSSILEHHPGYLFWKNKNLEYLGCNYPFAEFLGLKEPADIVGRIDQALPWKKSLTDSMEEDDRKVLDTEQPLSTQYEIMHPTQNILQFWSVTKTPLFQPNGEIKGVLTIGIDLSKIKNSGLMPFQTESASNGNNQSEADFMINMSHDLKTPLNSILGMAEVLNMNQYLPEQKEFIDGITLSGKSLLKLVDGILNYSKLEVGKEDLSPKKFNIKKLVEEVLMTMAQQAKSKNIELITYFSDAIPDTVISDATAIRRIVMNLTSNALKFTQKGHVLISVELIDLADDNVKLQISVEDTGIGISEQHLQNIFDRFYRANPTYKGDFPGTGLGLAIAKQLANDLGGSLKVNSKLGTGSTFWASIPFKIESTHSTDSEWRKSHTGRNILIVDELLIRGEVIHKHIGAENSTLCNGNDALSTFSNAYYANKPFDIVIIDDELTNTDPLQLADSLLSFSNDHYHPMLIFCTNARTLEEKEKVKTVGFHETLTKPIQPSELLDSLSAAWDSFPQKKPASTSPRAPKKHTVLLIEDDIFAQKFSKAMLKKLNCEVDLAGTGAAGLALAKSNYYDFIFVDIGLPDINGLEIVQAIRNEQENCDPKSTLIALTAHVSADNKKTAMDAGIQKFICKPASFQNFESTITEYSELEGLHA